MVIIIIIILRKQHFLSNHIIRFPLQEVVIVLTWIYSLQIIKFPFNWISDADSSTNDTQRYTKLESITNEAIIVDIQRETVSLNWQEKRYTWLIL